MKKYDENAHRADCDPRNTFRTPTDAFSVPRRGPRQDLGRRVLILPPDGRTCVTGDRGRSRETRRHTDIDVTCTRERA